MRLWVLAVVLLAACLAQAVEVGTTEAQKTQHTTEKGQQTQQPQQTQHPQQTQQPQQTQLQQKEQSQHEQLQEKQQPEETQQPQQPTVRQPQTQQRRILFLYPIAPRSHSNFFGGIIKALLDAGHHVTVVAPHKPSDAVRMVLLKEGDPSVLVKDPFREPRLQVAFAVSMAAPGLCSDLLAKPEVQELLKEEFDVAILSVALCGCFLSLVHQLKVPYIWATPAVRMGPITTYSGSPQFPSFMGTKVAYMRHPLSFHERAFATLFETSFTVLHSLMTEISTEQECRRRGLCPPDMPHLRDMASNASLIILNSVRSLEFPARPAVPAEVYAGGIHCRPAQPLPQELEAWVQGAGEAGFIFFSLGSMVKASTMPEKARVALLEAFATLDQRVLFKWDQDTMPDLPPNVRLAKWLPQQDILGHPRLRLFITHGGLMSTIEASCHGVPVLGMPVCSDQHTNMQETQGEGWGRHLSWEELTGEAMRDAILGLLTDADVQARARQRAVLMRDLPMTPAETVVFWVEYVIRHGGAPHLRCPAADLPWYKLYNVDVWATVAVVVLLVTYFSLRLTVALCSCLCRLCRPRSRKSKND